MSTDFDNSAVECGQQTVVLDPVHNIVGGKEAQIGEWPWQAAHLVADEDDWRFGCSASVISPDWLITAAHCV